MQLTEHSVNAAAATTAKTLICVPAFNEASNIGSVFDEIRALNLGGGFDILVVDDGSADGTRAVCEANGVPVISHIFNMGYGAALKTAYKYAHEHDYAYIIQMDADGQHDAVNIFNIAKALREDNEADIVIGSRYAVGGKKGVPFYKRLVIAFLSFFVRMCTGNRITDPTSGLQGISRRAFTFYARFDCFALDYPDANMIIQMALNQFRVMEIPAVMRPRLSGVSMHAGLYKQLKYVIKMFISVCIIYVREASAARNSR